MILEKKAYLFDLHPKENIYKAPKISKKFETVENPNGIGCLLSHRGRDVVILPGKTENGIQIYDSDREQTVEYDVGDHPVVISGNLHGEVFAHANSIGTEIKLHKIEDGTLLKSFDRGKSHVEITSIVFDKFCFRMAVASKKETIHVFALPKELALNGKTPEELKETAVLADSENPNAKSVPSSLLESRVNEQAGYLSKFFYGSKGEKSYCKVYIDCPEKQ